MSMSFPEPTRPAAAELDARRQFYRSALARCVRSRRIELQMTIAEAAKLAGMAFSEWALLEASGWVPERPELSPIAEVLEISVSTLSFLALLARYSREAAEAELS